MKFGKERLSEADRKFLRNLSLYLSAGFSIEDAVRKTSHPAYEYIKRGLILSEALSALSFPKLIIKNIKIGEETGKLKKVLEDINELIERKRKLDREVKVGMIFPLFLLWFALSILLAFLIFVIPEFKGIFEEFGTTPTGMTKIVMRISEVLRENLFLVLASFAIFSVLPFQLIVSVDFPVLRDHISSLIAKSLSICLKNGIELPRALELSSELAGGKLKEKMVDEMITILKGAEPTFSLFQDFSDELKRAYESGSEKLQIALEGISQIFDEMAKEKGELIKRSVEPIFFIAVSSIIIIIVLSIYIPLMKQIMQVM